MEFRRGSFSSLLFCSLFTFSIVGNVWAQDGVAGEPSSVVDSASPVSRRMVTGKVVFQPRYTRVVDEICDGAPCKESQMYWSLVIEANGSQYLLNEKLNLGQTRAPLVTELAGVSLRHGSVVELDGDFVDFGPHLYSIQKIHHLELVTDLGWACYNRGGGNSNIYARVWKEPFAAPHPEAQEGFKLRVQEVVNRTVRPIAYIREANVAVRSNQLVFQGESAAPKDIEVELEIRDTDPHALTVPSQLRIKAKASASALDRGGSEAAAASVFAMSCTRTRTEISLD